MKCGRRCNGGTEIQRHRDNFKLCVSVSTAWRHKFCCAFFVAVLIEPPQLLNLIIFVLGLSDKNRLMILDVSGVLR